MNGEKETISWLPIREQSEIRSVLGLAAFGLATGCRDLVPTSQSRGIVCYEPCDTDAVGAYRAKIAFKGVDSPELRRVISLLRRGDFMMYHFDFCCHGCDRQSEWHGQPFDLEISLTRLLMRLGDAVEFAIELAAIGTLLVQLPHIIATATAAIPRDAGP